MIKVLPQGWVVERTFAWLNRCRRLAKDFENLNRNALAFGQADVAKVEQFQMILLGRNVGWMATPSYAEAIYDTWLATDREISEEIASAAFGGDMDDARKLVDEG
jgi:hypothetical protein